MLNSSMDTLLDLEPMSASVQCTDSSLCSGHDCNFFLSCTQTTQFLLNHADNFHNFSHSSAYYIFHFFAHFPGIILDSLAHLLFSKLFPNNYLKPRSDNVSWFQKKLQPRPTFWKASTALSKMHAVLVTTFYILLPSLLIIVGIPK